MALNINGTTGISGVDGSVSAPALTGTDSNTGITFPSADTIKFSTGGVERISITNSVISGTGISSGGLEMVDQWRITSTFAFSSLTVMTSNWERVDTNGYGQLGTGMTESSGIFTFPSTGIYHIDFRASGSVANVTNHVGAIIRATTDGSNFSTAAAQYGGSPTANYNSGQSTQHIFDVTDTSTHKVSFAGEAGATVQYDGSSSISYTNVVFTKLGDT